MGLGNQIVGFEIFLDNLPKAKRKKTRSKGALEISDLQSLTRDFAFILDSDVAAGDVIRAARSAEKSLITDVTVFDLFEGEVLGPNRKSLGIEVTLQPRDKTLTDAEIEAIGERIVAGVAKATGGELRG